MIIKWSILQFDFDSWTNIKNILTTWSFTISSLWWNFRIKRRTTKGIHKNFPLFFQHSIRLKLEQSVFRNYLISKWSIKAVERHSSSFGLSVMRSHPINFHGSRRRLCVKKNERNSLRWTDDRWKDRKRKKSLKWSNFNYSTTVWSFKHSKASCSQVSTLPTKPRVCWFSILTRTYSAHVQCLFLDSLVAALNNGKWWWSSTVCCVYGEQQ